MLTIAVCDDNVQFARILISKLRELCATIVPDRILCDVVTAFTSADDVLQYIKNNSIDLLFLDIDMPKKTGFALAEEISKLYPDIIIIFVSSHDTLVYRAFEYNPFNFLRKSHLEAELPSAFSRAVNKYMYSRDTLDFTTTDGEITLRLKDIIYIESQRNYYNIYCVNNTYKCRGTISQVEQMVNGYDFCRTHAAYLVNLENIDRITGNNTILMKNGESLTISQRRYSDFKTSYTKFVRRRYAK